MISRSLLRGDFIQINLLDKPEYFGGVALDKDNERVKLAKMIPWHEFEDE